MSRVQRQGIILRFGSAVAPAQGGVSRVRLGRGLFPFRENPARGRFMARIETPRPIRGTQDRIGETQARFANVMAAFDCVLRLYGLSRVEVPVLEATAVVARSLGQKTNGVSKVMFTFPDRGGDRERKRTRRNPSHDSTTRIPD